MQKINKHSQKPFKNFMKWLKIIFYLTSIIFVINNISLFMVKKSEGEDNEKLLMDTEEDVPEIMSPKSLPWYFKQGTVRPIPGQINAIWPEEDPGDRILNQLMYVPLEKSKTPKKIFLSKDLNDYQARPGRHIFEDQKCPVNNCMIVYQKSEADAVVYKNKITDRRNSATPPHQIWIVFALESPFHSGKTLESNWTASYRGDSDMVTPYRKWVYYNESFKRTPVRRNYAGGKKKKVAMLVSNCRPKNKRMAYALELKKYIDVDIYGRCGEYYCPKNENCLKMLGKEYKFYLSFENCNCRDYITEKFFTNALSNNMLPIVMGAHPDDYLKWAPSNSYLHVDNFTSPKDLAKYLYLLDVDDDLYNSYFEWKGTGEFIELKFHCRLCALLHSNRANRTCYNFQKWWSGPGICTRGSWFNNSKFR